MWTGYCNPIFIRNVKYCRRGKTTNTGCRIDNAGSNMSEKLSKIRHFFLSGRLAGLEKLLFVSIILTCAALLAENTFIRTKLVLKPGGPHVVFLSDDRANGGASVAEWANYEAYEWRCSLRKQYDYPYCQFHIQLGGMDLSRYETMKIVLEYDPDAPPAPNESVRISLHNNSPLYSKNMPPGTLKLNEMEIPALYLKAPFTARMSDLKVPDWWLRQYNIPPQNTHVEYDNVAYLQILTGSDSRDGDYRFKLHSIEWEGNLIPPEKWYFGILIAWLAFMFGVLVYRVWHLKSEIDEHFAREQDLQRLNRMLDIKSRHFEKMARTDPLTGISNRAGISPILVDEVRSHLRTGNTLTVIMLAINDNHGHDYGDAVLIKIARTLVDTLRSSDTVARWGGEEFLIVCPATSLEHGKALAEKLRQRIKALSSSTKSPVSASLGVGMLGDESIDEFIKRVDDALYRAKQNGRDRVEVSKD
jgi:diguanylate cyclase (GGDEF)-like protein